MPRIIRLAVSNLLRIRTAEITPDGALVMVAGRNDQGKSSLLNSIALALSGKDTPAQPIRQGAARGYVVLETEDMIVTRSFSQTGGSSLEVRDKDGVKVTSPQAKLDALVSRVTFDPFQFTRMTPADQSNTVKKIAGLDFTELDEEYRTRYSERTEINRAVKDQDGKLKGITRSPDAPAEEVSVEELTESLEAAQKLNTENAKKRTALSDYNDDIDGAEAQVVARFDMVAKAEEALRLAEEALRIAKSDLKKWQTDVIECTSRRDAYKESIAGLEDQPVLPIMERLKSADSTNQKVRDNKRWTKEHQELVRLQGKSAELSDRLEAIQKEREEKLSNAKYPVDGLGFSESGVTFNGVPFEQSSSSVQIRVSVAIARSLNPGLPVMLIRDGSLLDKDALALIQKEAEETGCQVWVEIVGERDDATVIIEDGEVIATPAATTKKRK